MIKFGTSGHRGIIGKDFSSAHVIAIARAVGEYVKKFNDTPRIVIGYDPREGNTVDDVPTSYIQTAIKTLLMQNIDVYVFETVTPTPIVSWYIYKYRLDGGLIFTASHNPPEYNGIKFNPSNGAPAPTDVTNEIETLANQYFQNSDTVTQESNPTAQLHIINKTKEFARDLLANTMDYLQIDFFNFSDISIAVDAKHGAVSETWDSLFLGLGIQKFDILHKEPLSNFGGIEPNPTKHQTLSALIDKQKELKAPMAFANDPDGDRHVILDENGTIITPEETTIIILDYLLGKNANVYGVATTVASSRIIKLAAKRNKLKFLETPVGFKYFAPFFEAAKEDDQIVLGVESSGGFSTSFHTMEKCGFLPCIMLLFIQKELKTPLSKLREKILMKYGKTIFLEEEFHFKSAQKKAIIGFIKNATERQIQQYFKPKIQTIDKQDGLKIIFNNEDWILLRLSGTEPLARIYTETATNQDADQLLAVMKNNILKSINS